VTGSWRAAAAVLRDAGVRTVFGLPGDDMDALAAIAGAGMKFVLCRDQRNAVFMATGYAMQSGDLGVALIGKGPAVTNALTGLLEASCSAAPMLLLAAGTAVERRGSGAFQELDQLSVVAPLVRWAARVDHPDRLVPLLRRADLVARTDHGPVYVELPDHLLTAEIPMSRAGAPELETPAGVTVTAESPALRALHAAERPILLVGGGMRHRNRDRLVERVAERFGAAVVCTATGRGTVDESAPLFCGLAGLYTPDAVATLWAETDCVVALGSRLEETATFQWPARVGAEVPVVQVNTRAADLATDFGGPKVLADAGAVLRAWLDLPGGQGNARWAATVHAVHAELLAGRDAELRRLRAAPELHVAEVLAALAEVVPGDRILVQENGLQDMWSYRFPLYSCGADGGSVVPSEQTSLGFGAAAAVGVKLAAPDRPVVAFVGDGAFGMFAVDLPTALAQGVGILYVVLRNGGYGWLQTQLDQRDAPVPGYAFVDPAAVSLGAPALPGLRQVTADKATLVSDVAEAWKLAAAGHVVVLNVPARLADAMFGGEAAGGDFPAAGQGD
jgi:acetolactate synthase-1/2/3 large subunit